MPQRPSGEKERIALRREKVLAGRVAGLSNYKIADQLKVSEATVRKDANHELAKIIARNSDNAAQLRMIELQRLELPMVALAPKVEAGDLEAIEVWRKLSAERRKLLGLDAEGSIGGIIGKIRIVEFDLLPPAKKITSQVIETPKVEAVDAAS